MARVPRVCLALLFAGCTPTRGDVLSWNRVRLDALRERIQKVTASLPPPGEAARFAGHPPVEPLPRFGPALDNRANTDLLLYENLQHPRSAPMLPLKSWHLLQVLRLLEPAGPEDGTAREERDGAFREEVKHVLALRYLVVVRVLGPGASDGTPVEAFLVDLATGSIRASVTGTVQQDPAAELNALLRKASGGEF
jgi:hypothetical protein